MLVMNLGRREEISHMAFAPTGGALVASAYSGVRVWRELIDGSRGEIVPDTPFAPHAAFSADGRWLFIGGGELRRIDLATGKEVTMPRDNDHYIRLFQPSPVGPFVLVNRFPYRDRTDNRLALYRADDLSEAGKVWEVTRLWSEHPPQFLPDGDRFVRLQGRWVATYDTATGAPVGTPAPLECTGTVVLTPDAQRAVIGVTNRIDVYPLGASRRVAQIRNDSRKHFTGLAFHPSGRYLAATSEETVKFYDTTTWAEVRAFTWEIGRIRDVCFSADGTLAAAGSDRGQVVVWDVDL